MVSCPHCGFENPESTKHCTACGKPVSAAPGAPNLGRTVMGVGALKDGDDKKASKTSDAPGGPAAAVDLRATRMGVGPSGDPPSAAPAAPAAPSRPVGAIATPISPAVATPPTREAPAVH